MNDSGVVIGLVGSPNREGRTYQMVSSALRAAELAGAKTELIQMSEHVVAPCKDCSPWKCMKDLKCQYADPAFEFTSEKLLGCDALVLGTPIYWWDTSAMVKYLILKMFRVYALSGPMAGIPALGIGVAGGTGNGLVSGLRPLYHFFQMMQLRALEPLPVTRFNWDAALAQAAEQGTQLAKMAAEKQPFESLEERLLWYENLPYLGLSRPEERRLLAALAAEASPDDALAGLGRDLAQSDRLVAEGRALQSLQATTAVYREAVKAFERSASGQP